MARRKSRVSIELGVQGSESTPSSKFHKLPRIESSRLVHEPIHFHSDSKFNVQNALRIDSSSSESIPTRIIWFFKGLKGVRGPELGLRQQRTIGSSKCLWGFCFHVGQRLTSRLTDRKRSGPADWSSGKYERWSSSASSGSVGIGYDNRSGELTVACRNRHSSYAFA
ncbi:hypothetical protein PIB30_062544 [Stylosanthes scabra]|uniref:Uncharacterized protein n=1 Tax=Stylosanthes scabra TaxID=79078 RepID=A0ABU6ULQ1_9FABA|nr:hypothetical protein [Stylosanthes scabra]